MAVALLATAPWIACSGRDGAGSTAPARTGPDSAATAAPESELSRAQGPPPVPAEGTAIAIFAGGCFWCMEPPFDALDGVVSTTSGYTGGRVDQPSYEQVSSGTTGHLEALEVVYRPDRISYERLLAVFWKNVDPLDSGGQFCDRGTQYTTAIFALNDQQRAAAEASKAVLQGAFRSLEGASSSTQGASAGPVVTPIRQATTFYPAEDYHQDYYEKNPTRYKFYRSACGRDARLSRVWSSIPSDAFAWSRKAP